MSRKIVYSDDTLGGYFTGAFRQWFNDKSLKFQLPFRNCCAPKKYAEHLARMLNRFEKTNFNAKVTARRDKYIVYLKRSDQISSFLVFVRAANASLEFEGIRMDRDMQNITEPDVYMRQKLITIKQLKVPLNKLKTLRLYKECTDILRIIMKNSNTDAFTFRK